MCLRIVAWWCALSLLGLLGAEAWPAPRTEAADEPPGAEIAAAPVMLDGRLLFRVAGLTSFPAVERAALIQRKIADVARDASFPLSELRAEPRGPYVSIKARDREVMVVTELDARVEGVSTELMALAVRRRVQEALEQYRHARRPDVLLRSALYSLGATAVLAVLATAVTLLGRRLDAAIGRRLAHRIRALEIQSFAIVRAERIWRTVSVALRVIRWLVVLAMVFAWLNVVLGRFPWTRGTADRLLDLVIGPLATMGGSILVNVDNVAFLVILFFVIRFVLRLTRLFFDAVAAGSVSLSGFSREWAPPSYRIARLVVIAFALVVAYPYIPGSGSAAFQGISIFLGVLLSLGGSSVVANMISGYTLVYRRAFAVGDRVKIGDVVGEVIEIRPQVTHLRSPKNEEVIVPNSEILTHQVVNYSSLARERGLILHTTVGIGYETPWRQVEAMLVMAADRTPGLLREPPPFVLERGLGDFAVQYELNAYCNEPQQMMALYAALHRSILDVFNEYGVQIMTPAYEGDPPEPKVVPREQWHAAPALPDGRERPVAIPTAPADPGPSRGTGIPGSG
jgi:small-conductance mechanosensitive channel